VSEVDVHGRLLTSFTDVYMPGYLSADNDGRVLVADFWNDRILLLNSQLQLLRVIISNDSQVQLWWPRRLCFNERTSQLYVVHVSSSESHWSHVISVFNLR